MDLIQKSERVQWPYYVCRFLATHVPYLFPYRCTGMDLFRLSDRKTSYNFDYVSVVAIRQNNKKLSKYSNNVVNANTVLQDARTYKLNAGLRS
jgi:hypothetical protein